MHFSQVINWFKENPIAAGAVGAYILLGVIVLWLICRSGETFTATTFARAFLTALFALPIWPVIWLVWVLNFRKYAPDAIDLENFRLPVVDLGSYRADNVRFAPTAQKSVVDAEIIHDPQVPGASTRPPIKTSGPPPKGIRPAATAPRSKTKRVSNIPPKKEPVPKSSVVRPGAPPEKHAPSSPPPPAKPPLEPSGAEAAKAPQPKTPPPPSTVKSGPAESGKPSGPPIAPKWADTAVGPRSPEPPSAPPFVQKIHEASEKQKTSKGPAPFPKPIFPQTKSLKPSPATKKVSEGISEPEKPDVPEIPIK